MKASKKLPSIKTHPIVLVKHSQKASPAQAFLLERRTGTYGERVKIMWESTHEVAWYPVGHVIEANDEDEEDYDDNDVNPEGKVGGRRRRRRRSTRASKRKFETMIETQPNSNRTSETIDRTKEPKGRELLENMPKRRRSMGKRRVNEEEEDDVDDDVSALSFDSNESISQVISVSEGEERSEVVKSEPCQVTDDKPSAQTPTTKEKEPVKGAINKIESISCQQSPVESTPDGADTSATNIIASKIDRNPKSNNDDSNSSKLDEKLDDETLSKHLEEFLSSNPVLETQIEAALTAVDLICHGVRSQFPSESLDSLRTRVLRQRYDKRGGKLA